MEVPSHDVDGITALSRTDSLSSDSTSLSSNSGGNFSEVLNAWEAEVDAEEARAAQRTQASHAGASASGGSAAGGDQHADGCGNSGGGGGDGGSGSGGDAESNGAGRSSIGAGSAGLSGSGAGHRSGGGAAAFHRPPLRLQGQEEVSAESPRRPASAVALSATTPVSYPPRRLVTASAGPCRGIFAAESTPRPCELAPPFSMLWIGSTAVARSSRGSSSKGQPHLRRAAFVAGSVSALKRKPDKRSTPARDILLPRLPAPALDIIVPALPPATRAALRCTSKGLRALVDQHTHALTFRPDRRAADSLNQRGVKVSALFPALRTATLVLAGSCSGATGPHAVAAEGSAAEGATAGSPGAAASAAAAATAGRRGTQSKPQKPADAAAEAPLLPLSGWLVVCGLARCVTSLTMHVGELALFEDLALGITYPSLQRLDLMIGRSGNPHGSPPQVQFMVGLLPGLRHLGMAWAGGPDGGVAGSGGEGPVPSLATLAHGSRRLFLDGRPRLGPLLLAALADLKYLESLELRGFLIDTEGHAVLARHWPLLSGRLQRLVLSKLHLMVPTSTPPEQQLGELVGSCCQLRELHADLRLPASAGMPGLAAAVGAGGAAAAALLISLMYASRDVKAVRPENVPTSLTRLSLPGVCLTTLEEMAQLSRLRNLTSLEVTALGPGAGEHLEVLKELRLSECYWRQLLEMLPWKPEAGQAVSGAAMSAEGGSIGEAGRAPTGGPVLAWQEPGQAPGPPAIAAGRVALVAGTAGSFRGGGDTEVLLAQATGSRAVDAVAAESTGRGADSGGFCSTACGELKVLEVIVCERLDDWQAQDRGLLARVGKGLLPLVDGGCRVQLKVAPDAQPNIWNESDEDGKPWEPAAVWRNIKAAQNLRRLQAETKAIAERLARGRLLQAARRKERERPFVER